MARRIYSCSYTLTLFHSVNVVKLRIVHLQGHRIGVFCHIIFYPIPKMSPVDIDTSADDRLRSALSPVYGPRMDGFMLNIITGPIRRGKSGGLA